MVVGLGMIITGILIAMFPHLLSIIVATFLIFAGSILTAVSYRFKKVHKKSDDPFTDFFIRF